MALRRLKQVDGKTTIGELSSAYKTAESKEAYVVNTVYQTMRLEGQEVPKEIIRQMYRANLCQRS